MTILHSQKRSKKRVLWYRGFKIQNRTLKWKCTQCICSCSTNSESFRCTQCISFPQPAKSAKENVTSSSVVLHIFDQRLISRDQGRQHCPHTHQGCHHSPLPRFLTLTQRILSQSVREHMAVIRIHTSHMGTYSSHIQCCNMLYPCGLTCPVCACGTLSHVASHVNLEQHSRSRASTGRTHLATLVAIPKTIKIYLLYHGYVWWYLMFDVRIHHISGAFARLISWNMLKEVLLGRTQNTQATESYWIGLDRRPETQRQFPTIDDRMTIEWR